MRHTANIILSLALLLAIPIGFSGCKHKVDFTSIAVQDSVRHYYALIRGQRLNMQWKVANTGKAPLVISEIHPSCGCILSEDNPSVIPPGKVVILNFVYNSDKNIGLVKHTIRLYGNMLPNGRATLVFDTHVVPPTYGDTDYEEVHNASVAREASIEELVDGKESEKGYYVDPALQAHSNKRYLWRKDDRPGK